MQICNYIRLVLGEDVFCQPISIRQIGVLLSGNYDQLVALENAVDTLQKQYPQIHIRCGTGISLVIGNYYTQLTLAIVSHLDHHGDH